MVQPGHHARHRHPVLSRPSAPDAARAQDDHRRRGRHGAGMHAHPAPRGRPRDAACLPAAPPPALAGAVRPLLAPAIRTIYRPNPASKNYVQHLRLWYAQSHPDEDFAETFAVWLRPRSDWRKRYAGWPALKKLEYVDELMAEIAGEKPMLTQPPPRRSAEPRSTRRWPSITSRSRRSTRRRPPTIYDRDLRRIFSDEPRHHRAPAASTFLRQQPRADPAAWCRNGPASISSRSTRCSTR